MKIKKKKTVVHVFKNHRKHRLNTRVIDCLYMIVYGIHTHILGDIY